MLWESSNKEIVWVGRGLIGDSKPLENLATSPKWGWDRHYIVDLSQMQIQSKYADVFHFWHEVTRAAMAKISFKRMTVEQSRWWAYCLPIPGICELIVRVAKASIAAPTINGPPSSLDEALPSIIPFHYQETLGKSHFSAEALCATRIALKLPTLSSTMSVPKRKKYFVNLMTMRVSCSLSAAQSNTSTIVSGFRPI